LNWRSGLGRHLLRNVCCNLPWQLHLVSQVIVLHEQLIQQLQAPPIDPRVGLIRGTPDGLDELLAVSHQLVDYCVDDDAFVGLNDEISDSDALSLHGILSELNP